MQIKTVWTQGERKVRLESWLGGKIERILIISFNCGLHCFSLHTLFRKTIWLYPIHDETRAVKIINWIYRLLNIPIESWGIQSRTPHKVIPRPPPSWPRGLVNEWMCMCGLYKDEGSVYMHSAYIQLISTHHSFYTLNYAN